MCQDPEQGENMGHWGTFGELQWGIYSLSINVPMFPYGLSLLSFFSFLFQTTRYGTLSFLSWLHQQNSHFPSQLCVADPGRAFVEKTLVWVDLRDH